MRIIRVLLYSSFCISLIINTTCNSSRTGSVKDIDGNIYPTVKIGNQIWISENLKVKTLSNGLPIRQVADNLNWVDAEFPAYCWYENDTSILNQEYGALYNFYAINSGNLCPDGWKVPDYDDLLELINYLDPAMDTVAYEISKVAGELLKANDNKWQGQSDEAQDIHGFSALPGGVRSYNGDFFLQGEAGYFGSQTNEEVLSIRSVSTSLFLRDGLSKNIGVSVRCIKK